MEQEINPEAFEAEELDTPGAETPATEDAGLETPQSEQPDYEAEAALMGWQPKERFKGNPDEWTDAETFVRRGREVMPILRRNNERLMQKVMDLQKRIDEDRGVFREFREFHDKALKQQKETALQQLRAARREAISSGDGDQFEQIEARIKEVEAFTPPEMKEPAPQVPPEQAEWFERNAWYATDPDARDMADVIAQRLRREGSAKVGVEFLEDVRQAVEKAMPHKFRNPAREKPSSVESPSRRQVKAGKTFNDLPADAQGMCLRFERVIPDFDRNQFVKDYFGS